MSSARARRPVDDRALLFGGRAGAPAALGSAAEGEELAARNGGAVDALRERVGDMRHLALDIGGEVQAQHALLDSAGGAFDGASDSLAGAMRELRRLSRSGAGGHMCALAAFAAVFFFLVYLLLR